MRKIQKNALYSSNWFKKFPMPKTIFNISENMAKKILTKVNYENDHVHNNNNIILCVLGRCGFI